VLSVQSATAAPGIQIVKFVNGQDANSPPGPQVPAGSAVTFTYVVTNIGTVPLANVVVTDDRLGTIPSFTGDTNGNGLLDLTETWTYTATVTALAGQQTNVGTVTGNDVNPPGTQVTDSDPANYFGVPSGPTVDLAVTKTDGRTTYTPGTAISYTITVTNAGPSIAAGFSIADNVPAAITGVTAGCSVTGTGNCGTNGSVGNSVSFTGASLAPGAGNMLTLTVNGTVMVSATGDLVNIATVAAGAGSTDLDPANNMAIDTDTNLPTSTPTPTPTSILANISTRAFVQTDDNVIIDGFIVQGTQPKRVIIRAIGPELTQYGVLNVLVNPTLELHDGTGGLIASNGDWHDTIIVRGVNNMTGVGLVEVYDLD
jgi:uncharacterized repeat protein (TIGR01451 family)